VCGTLFIGHANSHRLSFATASLTHSRPPRWKPAGAFNPGQPSLAADFTIPAGGGGARVGVNVTLPLRQARKWAAGGGGKNMGVVVTLVDGTAGEVQLVTSPNTDAGARPTLFVEYGMR
jgi:hypothetical protein